LSFVELDAGNAIDSRSGANTTGGDMTAEQSIRSLAGGDIRLDSAISRHGNATFRAMQDIVADFIKSADELHMVAGVRDVDEPQVGVTEAGSIGLQRGEAPNAYLRAGDKLSAEHLRVADQLHLHGREITAPDIVDTDGGRLDSLFTAGNGGLADRVSLGIQT